MSEIGKQSNSESKIILDIEPVTSQVKAQIKNSSGNATLEVSEASR